MTVPDPSDTRQWPRSSPPTKPPTTNPRLHARSPQPRPSPRLDAKDETDLYVRDPDPDLDVAIAGPAVREAWATAVLAARQKQPLLAVGAPGTGKENVAKLFHQRGPRAKGPLVTLFV